MTMRDIVQDNYDEARMDDMPDLSSFRLGDHVVRFKVNCPDCGARVDDNGVCMMLCGW